MKVSEKTKERLEDIVDTAARFIKFAFFFGAGCYFAIKALIIIPQHPDIPDWTTFPVFLIAVLGGVLLAIQVNNEPTPRDLREMKRRQEIIDQTINEIIEERKMWGK
jgi:hypothetical protein